MDGNKGARYQQTSDYLGSFLELKGKNVKTDSKPDKNLGNYKMGHQQYGLGRGWCR
jgi:hypothetical protein